MRPFRQAIIIFILSFSMPCIAQTYKNQFDSLEEADNYFNNLEVKFSLGNYEDLPQLLIYKEYYNIDLINKPLLYFEGEK